MKLYLWVCDNSFLTPTSFPTSFPSWPPPFAIIIKIAKKAGKHEFYSTPAGWTHECASVVIVGFVGHICFSWAYARMCQSVLNERNSPNAACISHLL